jgi:predicted O-linked N-acetylglucosamine transferase (SPINDLY family)
MPLDPVLQRALDDARSGRLEAAVTNVRRILQRQPSNLDAIQVLSLLLMQSGQTDQAVHHLARAVQMAPRSAPLRNNFAHALVSARKNKEAVEQLRKAVEIDPSYAEAWMGLSCSLMQIPDAEAAIAAARRGLELRPDSADMVNNLALALGLSSRTEEMLEVAEKGHNAHPEHAKLHSLCLMMLNYTERPATEVAAAHRRFGELHPAVADVRPARTDPDPERRVRVGWLSPDLRTHSVGYFAEPLFEHAPAGFETHVFSLYASSADPVTKRLRGMATNWEEVAPLDDAALDRRIREKQIDILIELQGHTPGNRLVALACKPAPIIVTAIGYPNTTGVAAVDYRLVDTLTDPPGTEALATEKLLRIDPCFLCYKAPVDAPEPAMPAADSPITFGSFNTPSKIENLTVSVWRRALEAVPGSRLLLKATDLNEASTRASVLERLVRGGIDGSRVEIIPGTATVRDHLAVYSRVHIALDTAPYNGTTTTCEAMWMGVPVVTLEGDRHASRVGVSLLSVAGKREWVARTGEEYARIAGDLAMDRGVLATLRSELRGTMKVSPLCDGPAYASRFYGKLREAWRAWCGTGRS